MNAMDLMTGLNNVRDKFVVSAGEFRQGERQVRALPKRKLWLIAAVIACDARSASMNCSGTFRAWAEA